MREDTSDYDKRAIAEIHQWKTPELSWFGQAMRAVDWPLSQAGDWILEQQLVGAAIRKAISGVVGVCNDAAQWSVRQEAIYDEFRRAGHDLETPDDFASLRLEDIDRVVGYLDAKYKGLAAVEGAATGVAGLPGIVVDLPALVMLNLRAIGEYATYYGFDVTVQHERLFAMNLLGLASSPKDTAKQIAMAELVQIARDVAMRRSWTALEEHAFVQVIQQIARAVGIRLTKAKLAQVVPAVGAVVGPGVNDQRLSATGPDGSFMFPGLQAGSYHTVYRFQRSDQPSANAVEFFPVYESDADPTALPESAHDWFGPVDGGHVKPRDTGGSLPQDLVIQVEPHWKATWLPIWP